MDGSEENWDGVDDVVLEIDLGGGGIDDIEPPDEGGGGGGPRRPRDPRRVPEPTNHRLTVVICAVAVVFGMLSMTTIHMSRSGSGGGMIAYMLGFGFLSSFLVVFYGGGLWLGARMREARERPV